MPERILQHELVGLCSDILRMPSFRGMESDLAHWLARFFATRGYDVDLQEVEPGRYQTIATLKGYGGGPALMFNGHLDIDPILSGWKRHPFEPAVEGDRLYGAGARNMKGGLSAMIMAAEAIRKSGKPLCGDLTVACVVGELQGGVGTLHALRQGVSADGAIVPEPVGADNIVTSTSGVLQLALTTFGFSEHISRHDEAISPVSMMIEVISALEHARFTHVPDFELPAIPRVGIGGIIAGVGPEYNLQSPAHSPDRCTITLDIRYVAGMTVESITRDLIVAIDATCESDTDLRYEITSCSRPPYELNRTVFPPTAVSNSERVVSLLTDAYAAIARTPLSGFGKVAPCSYMGADSAHLSAAGIPSVLFGPSGPRRTPEDVDDCVSIREMSLVSQVLADTARRFCRTAT